jgi:hypothetical protein
MLTAMLIAVAQPVNADNVVKTGTITVSGTAQGLHEATGIGLPWPAGTTGAVLYVAGTATTDSVRWWCNATPTNAAGFIAKDGTTITLRNAQDAKNFKVILNAGAGGAKVYVMIISK